jgi:hypothetical protein
MRKTGLAAALLLGTALGVPAQAQDNMDKLTNMQRTDATFTEIPQTGPTADALADIVQYINVPEGFEVSLFVDRDRNRVADQVKDFAPSITFDIPTGPASRLTASSTSPSATGCWCSRRPSSSTKGRIRRWPPSWRRAS